MSIPHDPYRAFRHPNYRLLLTASTLSFIGGILESTALGWELYERTQDPLVLGNVGLAQFLPVLLLALPAGHVADNFDRKKVAIVMRLLEVCSALGLAYLSWTHGSVGFVYLLILFASVARTFNAPAFSTFMPNSVPREDFSNAVTWNATVGQLAAMIAPAFAGLLIATLAPIKIDGGPINVGATLSYVLAAMLSLIVVLCVSRLNIKGNIVVRKAPTLKDVLGGVSFVFTEKIILAAITLDLFAVLFGGAVALLPVFAKDILNVGPEGFGVLRAAPAVGATLMAIVLTRLPPMRRAGRTLLIAVAGFGLATIVFGLSRNFWLSLVALALTGMFDNVSVVIRSALTPLRTPDEMRGRVSAVERVFISSSNELGAWESGVTAAAFGPILSVVGGGIGTLVVVGLVYAGFPQLRKLKRLEAD